MSRPPLSLRRSATPPKRRKRNDRSTSQWCTFRRPKPVHFSAPLDSWPTPTHRIWHRVRTRSLHLLRSRRTVAGFHLRFCSRQGGGSGYGAVCGASRSSSLDEPPGLVTAPRPASLAGLASACFEWLLEGVEAAAQEGEDRVDLCRELLGRPWSRFRGALLGQEVEGCSERCGDELC